jgi:ABC-2 type transport system ATP-binding protein
MIEVDHLSKVFGRTTAVKDISFQVEKGEILGFLGPNGAGKTTTMRVLTCFLPATRGTARVAGLDILENPLEVRRRLGYLPETVPLYNDMTVTGYLDFMGRIKGVGKENRARRIEEVMESCGLTDRRSTIIGKLSKGYRQRVGLAQALIHDPDILILDEPTIGLDPAQTREVRELIRRLSGEHTIILSTHILPEVSMVCNRVIIINRGEIAAMDTPANLTAQLRKSEVVYLEVRGASEKVVQTLQAVEGVVNVIPQPNGHEAVQAYQVETGLGQDLREKLAATLIGAKFGLLEMRPVQMTLEDIFLEITTEEEHGT